MFPSQIPSIHLMPAPFDWIEIPAGKVFLAAGGYLKNITTFDVAAFAITKYPVTNAQFSKFVEAGGYENQQWWKVGWDMRVSQKWNEPRYWQDIKWNQPDYPVVGVSWYEAVAFCKWLSEVSGEKVKLPTEQQWQYAAQGNDEYLYPWGNKWDSSCCNNYIDGKGAGRTTPVTHYEGKGDSPFGVMDMVGNVSEWCLTAYETGSNDVKGLAVTRVLRGGSWGDTGVGGFFTRSRLGGKPWMRSTNEGFRCVRSE